jgi:hypothetical protein
MANLRLHRLKAGGIDQKSKVKSFRELRNWLADPLLTELTIMLAILLFVVVPLQAAGIVAAHNFGIVFGLVLVAAASPMLRRSSVNCIRQHYWRGSLPWSSNIVTVKSDLRLLPR